MADASNDTPGTLSDEQATWLADTMARNRARFAGWSMEAGGDAGAGDGGDTSGGDTADQSGAGDAGDEGGDDTDQEGNRVQRANREAQRYRTELRTTQETVQTLQQQVEQSGAVLTALRAAFGIEGDAGNDDPAEQVTELTTRVQSLTGDNAALSAALVVHDLAADNGAKATALLDSKNFTTTLAGLDPEASDYREQVASAIKDAVSKNTAFRAGLGSGRGGSELNGDQREQQNQKPKGLSAAISAAYAGRK